MACNILLGVAVIALCAVAVVATGGCGLAAVMAEGALKGALWGALKGTAGGMLVGAMNYYEKNGTLDGSGQAILESGSTGFMIGTAAGAADGAKGAAKEWFKNPTYCFVKGTLVWTVVGLVAIENIQPGDVVYAKEAVGIEQSVDVKQDIETAPVLEVFSHEVDETYVVTIDGEDIETTAEHPFYDEDGEQVEAKDLKEGDELTTADGDTATVDSVECVHHDEPVTVYNFAVMEDHTFFVGEHGVLVHNTCEKPEKTYQTYTKTNPETGEVYSGRTSGYGSAVDNVKKRDLNHHMNDKGFGPAILDESSADYNSIRGREQMLIENYGGAKSVGGTSGNAINGIGPNNKNKSNYIKAATDAFEKVTR